ncbi:MAG: hypothetical protein KDD43_06695, partial [Bdellovibrionales bacterium]|nr:hypothetical protein [Bdellovibrionales bacterium]
NGSAYNQIGFPLGVSSDGNRLLAIDYGSDRLMIFNSIPTANDASANVIFGVAYGTANDRLKVPVGVFFDGTKIFVADRGNHRVLIWNSLPSADHTLPDVVLGQANLTTGTANPGGVGANTLFDPHFVHYDGCRLFVGDKSNHRVLIY